MREKTFQVVFTFYTTAGAMAMERTCKKQGLPGRLASAPRAVTSDCGMAWIAPAEARPELESASGVPEFAGVYELML